MGITAKSFLVTAASIAVLTSGASFVMGIVERTQDKTPQGVCVLYSTEVNQPTWITSPTFKDNVVSCDQGTFVSTDPQAPSPVLGD